MTKKFQQNYTLGVFTWMVCNAKCGFCNAQLWKNKYENYWIKKEADYSTFYTFNKIKKDILLKVKKWANCIIYEWWDFTIHPDIFKILEFWKSLWIIQTIQTNWIKLSDLNFVKKLKNYWINEINFSMHSYEKSNFDKIMWLEWAFENTIKWLINCNNVWINITNNFVLTKDNLNDLEGILLLLFKFNVKLFNITMYLPVTNFPDDFHNKFMVSPIDAWKKISLMLKLYNEINRLTNNKLNLQLKFHNIWRCIFDKEFHNINFEFDLDRRLKANKYVEGTWFYKKESCKKCIYNNNCPWFTKKYIKVFWDDYINPILE
jgi:MoaA/NifB/PqqE/SkfB family radical SAM enzyme